MTSWRYRFLDRCGLCVTERQAIEESIDALVTAARNHERDLKLTRTRDAERARREQAESALAAVRHERDEARAALATEQDQRSDALRERNAAIEEARSATAANQILKAEVTRLDAAERDRNAALTVLRGPAGENYTSCERAAEAVVAELARVSAAGAWSAELAGAPSQTVSGLLSRVDLTHEVRWHDPDGTAWRARLRDSNRETDPRIEFECYLAGGWYAFAPAAVDFGQVAELVEVA